MRLTPKEIEVLMLMRQGLTNEQIGKNLSCAASTVKVHVRSIYRALNVTKKAVSWVPRGQRYGIL